MDGNGNKLGSNAATPMRARGDRLQDESVARSVPGHVDKTHQPPVMSGTNPAKTVVIELGLPVKLPQRCVVESLGSVEGD